MSRIRFGVFMSPFHPPGKGQNPTFALQRDVETIELLDRLGYEEAWFGEHHSGGTEIIAAPDIFVAHVAERTRHIKLGAGVISLPFHNPLWVADRAILLDHLTRGRFMLGLGVGALPTDATTIGMAPQSQRAALEEDTGVLMQLLRTDEPVTRTTERYTLVNAKCQLRPFTDPCFEVGVAAIKSPSGPRIAGKYGISLLQVGATIVGDVDLLAMHWNIAEQCAAESDSTVDRNGWRLVGPMHIAETRAQAAKDVAYGIEDWFHYLQHVAAIPQFRPLGNTLQERIDWVNNSGVGVIGTPDDAITKIEELHAQSNGGFGCYLLMAHEWASPRATQRHYELFAQYVKPRFQGLSKSLLQAAADAAEQHETLDAQQAIAIDEWTEKHRSK